MPKPCECGNNRWKTKVKGVAYTCRRCGKLRGQVPKEETG